MAAWKFKLKLNMVDFLTEKYDIDLSKFFSYIVSLNENEIAFVTKSTLYIVSNS